MDPLPLPADLIDHIRHILHATRLQAAVRGSAVRRRAEATRQRQRREGTIPDYDMDYDTESFALAVPTLVTVANTDTKMAVATTAIVCPTK